MEKNISTMKEYSGLPVEIVKLSTEDVVLGSNIITGSDIWGDFEGFDDPEL